MKYTMENNLWMVFNKVKIYNLQKYSNMTRHLQFNLLFNNQLHPKLKK